MKLSTWLALFHWNRLQQAEDLKGEYAHGSCTGISPQWLPCALSTLA